MSKGTDTQVGVTRGAAKDFSSEGTPAGQLRAGNLRLPIGSERSSLGHNCRTGYRLMGHFGHAYTGHPFRDGSNASEA